MSVQDIVRQYVSLKIEKDAHQERLREIEQECERLAPRILEWFADEGIENQRVNVDGESHTIFTALQVRARAKAGMGDALADALVDAGHVDLVKANVHAGTLTAWVKEMEEGDGIPATVTPYLAISRYREVRVNHVAASHR